MVQTACSVQSPQPPVVRVELTVVLVQMVVLVAVAAIQRDHQMVAPVPVDKALLGVLV
jgi:hypothetical protein